MHYLPLNLGRADPFATTNLLPNLYAASFLSFLMLLTCCRCRPLRLNASVLGLCPFVLGSVCGLVCVRSVGVFFLPHLGLLGAAAAQAGIPGRQNSQPGDQQIN